MGTRFYLIRHGQSTFNAEGRFQGCNDEAVLTEKGIATAEAAGRYLRGANLDAVVTSPLQRAAQTAKYLCAQLDRQLVLETEPALREIELYLWERKPLAEVKAEQPEEFRIWKQEPHLFRIGDHRPVVELFERARNLWPRLLDRYRGRQVLLATHGGMARALIGTAIGFDERRYHCLQQSNGGISMLDFPAGDVRSARILTVNATDYEGARLPKIKEVKEGVRVIMIAAGEASDEQRGHIADILARAKPENVWAGSEDVAQVARTLVPGIVKVREDMPHSDAGRPLTTVLWFVTPAVLAETCLGLLGVSADAAERLAVIPLTLTVSHHDGTRSPGVVQGVNLYDRLRLAPFKG